MLAAGTFLAALRLIACRTLAAIRREVPAVPASLPASTACNCAHFATPNALPRRSTVHWEVRRFSLQVADGTLKDHMLRVALRTKLCPCFVGGLCQIAICVG